MCNQCSNVAVSYDGKCLDHINYQSRSSYYDRPMPTPAMKNPFGMEIECLPKEGESYEKIRSVERFAATDTSINEGVEYKICADARKIGDRGADVAQRARLAGARVDKRCGIHVHMSRPCLLKTITGRSLYVNTDSTMLHRLYQLVSKIQPEFMAMIPNRRRDNEYCRAINSAGELTDHHVWLSVSNQVPTMENRIHPGTLNPWKVKAWSEVCKHLQKLCNDVILNAESNYDTLTEKALTDGFISSLPSGLAKRYVNARIDSNGSLKKFGF